MFLTRFFAFFATKKRYFEKYRCKLLCYNVLVISAVWVSSIAAGIAAA